MSIWTCSTCRAALPASQRECDHRAAIELLPALLTLAAFQATELSPELGSGPMPEFTPN